MPGQTRRPSERRRGSEGPESEDRVSARIAALELPSFLFDERLRLLIFGGKGGTGKTTCATAAALYRSRAEPAARILLVSTDPAHSLRDSLDGISTPANLETIELDAVAYLDDFRRKHGDQLLEIADRGTFLDREDISGFLDLSLPGLDELFGFIEISRWVREGKYDRIIVDSAPTGHTLRLLAMPGMFEKWVEALDGLLGKYRYMSEVFKGVYEPNELDEFIDGLAESAEEMEGLLRDRTRCRFIPVFLAESVVVGETLRLLADLDRLGIGSDEVVVNRIYPETGCPACSAPRYGQLQTIERLPPEMKDRSLWLLPLFPREVRGETLLEVWEKVERFSPDTLKQQRGPAAQAAGPVVKNPAPLPGPGTSLLVFAGKGGVGKTTLASATAIRLTREYPDKKVLLFSSDPAHSISDCLDMKAGATPALVFPGLFALEIDPESEFDALKESYRQELQEFLQSLLHNIDITFDREVMERIVDLSPPGLDEIMALTRMMDFLDADRYDLLVLDTAPTGHLIRLLELPEILDQWIKQFFELFLKYSNIFRLPRMAERLVSLSKALKRLKAALKDSRRTSLYTVTIPTGMAREETADLISACRRAGIHVPMLFINMVSSPDHCPFCIELNRTESVTIEKMADEFPDQHQAVIHRMQPQPRGIELLTDLGDALYREV